MKTNAQLRPARESDASDLACLFDIAARGNALWTWSTLREPGQSAIEVGRNRIRTNTAHPSYYKNFTIAEIEGAVAGAFAGRLIPIPYHRGDAADLLETLAPYLALEAIAAGSWDLFVVAVYPEFRGRGLGSELLRHAEKIGRESGASRMSIIVEDANAGALRLYLRHGFAEWARRPYVPFPGSMDKGDWVLLGKGMATEET